ncbi:unnamed protein product [Vitrella brassicaformis CCMP3155]|uniref:Ion transport domain-containing protein n=1 Tax=Vitrella brassicaformis (strain CCMP3155) TaxID=1169540 RepID=A0A0G4G2A3_VITBC|nr:unnamed protein product [Vitrella brassicaformis CCMP3155]|eukprot:CEM21877.1 unnamed protein product [Vitrella brassicaformis CCMP3155]
MGWGVPGEDPCSSVASSSRENKCSGMEMLFEVRDDVVEVMLTANPQLWKIKGKTGRTALDLAINNLDKKQAKALAAMFAAAGGAVIERLEKSSESLNKMSQPEIFPKVFPIVKRGIGERLRRSYSLGVVGLRWCSKFRGLVKSRQKDSLTDDFEKTAGWVEALTAKFCSDTMLGDFEQSFEGKEREWFALLESAEPLTVVTQAFNFVQLTPRDVFITRVLSMLLMVAFVLLHIESIKGDSDVMLPGVWPLGIRLKTAYWTDSWNRLDAGTSLSIAIFIAIHFIGWSSEAEVSSGIVVALLFVLRLLQTASLHPAVGPLILAVVRMFSDISMFLCLYVYILLVFAGVFTLLSSDEDHQYFGSFPKAILTLFYAALGDFSEALTNAIESHDTLGPSCCSPTPSSRPSYSCVDTTHALSTD